MQKISVPVKRNRRWPAAAARRRVAAGDTPPRFSVQTTATTHYRQLDVTTPEPTSPPTAPPTAGEATVEVPPPVVFFDGVCGLCNRFVDLVLRADRKATFRFAPLQGETARLVLPEPTADPLAWSVVYWDEAGLHRESDASLRIYRRLGGLYWPLGLALFVPRVLRDPVYRWVARNRYRWFGKRDTCRVPTPEQRDRFLP